MSRPVPSIIGKIRSSDDGSGVGYMSCLPTADLLIAYSWVSAPAADDAHLLGLIEDELRFRGVL